MRGGFLIWKQNGKHFYVVERLFPCLCEEPSLDSHRIKCKKMLRLKAVSVRNDKQLLLQFSAVWNTNKATRHSIFCWPRCWPFHFTHVPSSQRICLTRLNWNNAKFNNLECHSSATWKKILLYFTLVSASICKFPDLTIIAIFSIDLAYFAQTLSRTSFNGTV